MPCIDTSIPDTFNKEAMSVEFLSNPLLPHIFHKSLHETYLTTAALVIQQLVVMRLGISKVAGWTET